jgi:hypothetical protein
MGARAARPGQPRTEVRGQRDLYRELRERELPPEEALRMVLAKILVSPAFLYKREEPGPEKEAVPVSDWELATRLSYFLWSSIRDEERWQWASKNQLHHPDVLVGQMRLRGSHRLCYGGPGDIDQTRSEGSTSPPRKQGNRPAARF